MIVSFSGELTSHLGQSSAEGAAKIWGDQSNKQLKMIAGRAGKRNGIWLDGVFFYVVIQAFHVINDRNKFKV